MKNLIILNLALRTSSVYVIFLIVQGNFRLIINYKILHCLNSTLTVAS